MAITMIMRIINSHHQSCEAYHAQSTTAVMVMAKVMAIEGLTAMEGSTAMAMAMNLKAMKGLVATATEMED